MATALPEVDLDAFRERLMAAAVGGLGEGVVERLHTHYRELRRWSPALSLVGPAAAAGAVERLYAEALAALPLLTPGQGTLVDVGSGAGFPGLVIAAARPDLAVTLVEPRQRRWAFLMAASRRAGIGCRCLEARIETPLPPELPEAIDVVTLQALKLPPRELAALAARLTPRGRFLLWLGAADPVLPPGLRPTRSLPLAGSENRRIQEIRPG